MQLDFYSELPCAVLVTDAHERVMTANPALIELIQGDGMLSVPGSVAALLTMASHIFCQTHVLPMLRREGAVHEMFLHLKSASGTPVPVMTNVKKTTVQGEPAYIWVFFVARERSRFESELLEARKRSENLAAHLLEAHEQLRDLNVKLETRIEVTEDANRSLKILTNTDSLTGLGNRRTLLEVETVLGQNQGTPFSVLMLDIDHFKAVNDTYGHDRGDAVLQAIGQCLQSAARKGDTVIRYGGEEFALILVNSNAAQSLIVAQRVHGMIAAAQPGGLSLTVSIGVATTQSGQPYDLTATLKQADEAVYAAKHQGRNRTVHRNSPEFASL
jgi:two-component system cell cycle response regulator